MTWDDFYMALAKTYASKSKDPSSQIGAVIIGPDKEQRSGGYNGLPRGLDDTRPERHVRPIKYRYYEHAERNAIFNAARVGTPVKGCVIYISGMPPCSDCARAIIQSGITEVVCETLDYPERWKEDMDISLSILFEAGIRVRRCKP